VQIKNQDIAFRRSEALVDAVFIGFLQNAKFSPQCRRKKRLQRAVV
jgi:hypothetical protein